MCICVHVSCRTRVQYTAQSRSRLQWARDPEQASLGGEKQRTHTRTHTQLHSAHKISTSRVRVLVALLAFARLCLRVLNGCTVPTCVCVCAGVICPMTTLRSTLSTLPSTVTVTLQQAVQLVYATRTDLIHGHIALACSHCYGTEVGCLLAWVR